MTAATTALHMYKNHHCIKDSFTPSQSGLLYRRKSLTNHLRHCTDIPYSTKTEISNAAALKKGFIAVKPFLKYLPKIISAETVKLFLCHNTEKGISHVTMTESTGWKHVQENTQDPYFFKLG